MSQHFTDVFSSVAQIRSGLADGGGIHLTNDQVYLLLLIKEYMSATGKVSVTKRELFDALVKECLNFSRATHNRAVNALLKAKLLQSMNVRPKNGWLGKGEEFRLTMASKRVDAILMTLNGQR